MDNYKLNYIIINKNIFCNNYQKLELQKMIIHPIFLICEMWWLGRVASSMK